MKIYIDELEKVQYTEQERIDRSIWVSPFTSLLTVNQVKEFFQYQKECGLITSIRIKQGKPVESKGNVPNIYAVVEFAHVNSVARALRVASKKESMIYGQRVRIYKAGSNVSQPTNDKSREQAAQRATPIAKGG